MTNPQMLKCLMAVISTQACVKGTSLVSNSQLPAIIRGVAWGVASAFDHSNRPELDSKL